MRTVFWVFPIVKPKVLRPKVLFASRMENETDNRKDNSKCLKVGYFFKKLANLMGE